MSYPFIDFQEAWQKQLENGLRPTIVCLCGSTRYKEAYIAANFRETMNGRIVLSVGWFTHADGVTYEVTEDEKSRLDLLHLRKVEMADEVLVLNVDDYIGRSTSVELAHARNLGRTVRWWRLPSVHALPGEGQ